MRRSIIFIILLGLYACNKNGEENAQGEWIKGTETEKIKIVEKQFRGFDNAMAETDYRYQELYWAGKDQNWDYANYQITKIQLAIENGLVRRPKRAKSAEYFLINVIPAVKKSIESKDTAIFNQAFNSLMIHCNSCHAKEEVSSFTVKAPINRQSSIRY